MATLTVKSTYSLDIETVRTLEWLADRWRISKSEALRRVIRDAARDRAPASNASLEALDRLQRTAGLDAASARRWVARARTERRLSSSRKRE
jgi:hypothetical protein